MATFQYEAMNQTGQEVKDRLRPPAPRMPWRRSATSSFSRRPDPREGRQEEEAEGGAGKKKKGGTRISIGGVKQKQ
jgi:hypothetical protein